MESIRLQTTQNVDIEYEVASIGDRILATLLDYLFFLGYGLIVAVIISLLSSAGISPYFYLLFLLPILLYDLVFESLFEGRSLGKMIMKIKVVKIDGTQADFGAYLLRWLFRIIDIRLFSGGVALIIIVMNGKGQRLGDIAAGTTVIKIKQGAQLSSTILVRTKPEYTIVFNEVERLSDNDVAIIKDVLAISLQNDNTEALQKLALKTKETMKVSSDLPPVVFLQTVLLDYSFYNFDKWSI